MAGPDSGADRDAGATLAAHASICQQLGDATAAGSVDHGVERRTAA